MLVSDLSDPIVPGGEASFQLPEEPLLRGGSQGGASAAFGGVEVEQLLLCETSDRCASKARPATRLSRSQLSGWRARVRDRLLLRLPSAAPHDILAWTKYLIVPYDNLELSWTEESVDSLVQSLGGSLT